ncbi:MAG: hypothetical protein K0S37_2386 [Microbacterium sp.]|jgi:hypothetical protein|nr:hypothetical protein [Microbacterium sp.]
MTQATICEQCEQRLRPYGTRKADHPGTVARGGAAICMTCMQRRGRAYKKRAEVAVIAEVELVEQAIVPVRSWLKPSTYRHLRAIADAKGLQDVGVLLSQLADHVAKKAR